jgi:hypothetical protein
MNRIRFHTNERSREQRKSKKPKTPGHCPELIPSENCELEEKIALMRTAVVARAVRSVCENVGGGWGEIDREVMTDYQELFGM